MYGHDDKRNQTRAHCSAYQRWAGGYSRDAMAGKRAQADAAFRKVGITFAVYGCDVGTERLIPFDPIPRIIPSTEWHTLQKGLIQRVRALNLLIHDVYHDQKIVKAGVVPAEQIYLNAQYRPQMQCVNVALVNYCHISGMDIVRAGQGEYYVLEDNLRVPSGVSYMLEGRKMMMRLFPEAFSQMPISPIEHYPDLLLETLRASAPMGVDEPNVVVMTPGMYNSTYFEHAFLAQQMGVELIEGKDLFVDDGLVYVRTTQGLHAFLTRFLDRINALGKGISQDFLEA